MRDAEQSLNLSTGTVELELPMLGADTRAQDWRLANAGLDSRAAASAMPTASRSPAFGADAASFQDSIAYANGGARRPQVSQLPWMAQHHQLARAEVAHEFELPDLRAARPMPTQVPSGGSAGKSGGCACGGNCGGKPGGSCGNKGAAVHGASAGNPWPLDDARHNLVLLAQELLLLEGHLADPERRCPSCVTKHALTVRALADEGRRLDGGGRLATVWEAAGKLPISASAPAIGSSAAHLAGHLLRLARAAAAERATGKAESPNRIKGAPRDPANVNCDASDILAAMLVYVVLLFLGVSVEDAQLALADLLDGCSGAVDLPDMIGGGAGETSRSNRGYSPFLKPGEYLGSCPPKITFSKDVCQVPGGSGVGGNYCFLNCQDLSGQKGYPIYKLAWDGEGYPVDLKCTSCK